MKVQLEDYCNNCGESCTSSDPLLKNVLGLIDAKVCGAYDSEHLSDLITYTFSLCEKCLRKMFDGFKHKPDVTNYFYGDIKENYEDIHGKGEK